MPTEPILYGSSLGVALLALAWRPWAEPDGDGGSPWAWLVTALALGLAPLVGYYGVSGAPPLTPAKALHWVVSLAPIVALCVTPLATRGGVERGLAALVLAGLIVYYLLRVMPAPADYNGWEGAQLLGWWLGSAAVLLIASAGTLELTTRLGGGAGPESGAVLLAWATVCALAMGRSSGESALVIAACASVIGVACAVSTWRGSLAIWRGTTGAIAFSLPAILFIGAFYGDSLPREGAAVVALSAQAAWVPLGARRPWLAALLRAGLVLGVGLGACAWWGPPPAEDYGY